MTFEWDDEKADKNRRKHGIHFSEVLGVFNDLSVIRILHARRADRRMVRIYEGKEE